MDDLISEFITETTEGLSLLDQELIKLEQNPGDPAILGNIFRIVHTIKGTCGFLGLPRLESVAHASENVLGKIRDRKLEATPAAITLVLASLDNIKELIDYLSQNGQEPPGDDAALIGRLNHFADTGQVLGESSAPAEAAGEEPFDLTQFFKGDDDLAALLAEQGLAQPAESLSETQAEAQMEAAVLAEPPAPAAPPPAKPAPQDTPKAEAPKGEAKDANANQSIRVNLDVLENLMQMVSELVLTRNQLMQIARTKEDRDFLTPLHQLSHITSELQEGVMKTRMQPIGNAWAKFPRLIRDLSLELGKKIELRMHGSETELDRQLLEMIKDPLTHMVRNSCDHGLEMPADRKAAGKSDTGTVSLSAFHEGGHIIIEIADDGKGLNVARIREKAVTNGLATAAEMESMSDQQAMQFIFKPGFSTAEKVTAVSGRGVGMDVVRTNIEKIGGTIELSSTLGKGSKFSIKIPLTLAIVSVLIVEACGEKFAIPQINVTELVRVHPDTQTRLEYINRQPVMRLREKLLPIAGLGGMLGIDPEGTGQKPEDAYIVVCRVGGSEFGLMVDRVFDTEEIVVKPVSPLIKSIPVYSGNTILGDGSIIMILDPNGLARAVGNIRLEDGQQDGYAAAQGANPEKEVSFLLFNAGKAAHGTNAGAPKAVPLELVSRLEEIDVSTIECAGNHPVVQYRGELMRLIILDKEFSLPDTGVVQVIVFTYDKKTIGLVVESIIDIVRAPFKVKMQGEDKRFLGSMVIAGHATDVIDVAQLLSELIDHAVSEAGPSGKAKASEFNLLLVEDSPFFRNLTVPFLSASGYNVKAVESAAEALKLVSAREQPFHMIITDIEMPGMNGFEFTAACRALPHLRELPMVAYTASLSNEVVRKGRDAGLDDCIIKTDRPGLLQAVARYLMDEKELAA